MATTYKADNYGDPFPTIAHACVALKREFLFTVGTALIINDLIKLCPIKAVLPVVIDDYYIDLPDLDTGGTPANKLDLGDNTTDDVFVAASTKGQAAAIITASVDGTKGVIPKLYSADNDFALHVDTAPQTGATAVKIRGWMEYHMVGIASLL